MAEATKNVTGTTDVQKLLKNIQVAVHGEEVRGSIHDALRQCYYDGKAGGNDLEARDRAAAAEARMDTFTKLKGGSTAADAELTDIRVSAWSDPKTGKAIEYESAGTAVREQIRETRTIEVCPDEPLRENTAMWINLEESDSFIVPEVNDDDVSTGDTWSSEKLSSLLDYTYGPCGTLSKEYEKITKHEDVVCDNTGAFIDSDYGHTYGFVAETDFYIWNENNLGDESYLSIALFRYGEPTPENFAGIYRYTDDGEDTLPTLDKKVFVSRGYYIAISSVLGEFCFNTTYPALGYKANESMSLGTSHMHQISDELHIDTLFDTETFVPMTEQYDGFTVKPNSNFNTNKGFEYNETTDTYYCEALTDFVIYAGAAAPEYLAITIAEGTMDNPVYVTRYRRYKTEDTLPREGNPLTITKGTIFMVTATTGVSFALYTNYPKCGLYLNKKIKIHDAVTETKQLVIDYKTTSSKDMFTIFKLTGDGNYYLGTSFVREPMTSINSDVWRISTVKLYNLNFVETGDEDVVYGGEWECAIAESGASDFMGGTLHGDEMTSYFKAFLDGKPLDLSNDFSISGKRFEFLNVSVLNRVDTPDEEVCNHVKKYTFTADDITVDQSFKFLEQMTLDPSYVAMLPINRTYTTTAWRDTLDHIEDISEDGHVRYYTNGNKQKVFMSGDNLTATVDIDCESSHTGRLFISDSASPRYNKVYFSFIGAGGSVSAGESVRVITKYTIDMSI